MNQHRFLSGRRPTIEILTLLAAGVVLALLAGCCDNRSSIAYPVGGDGRPPAAQFNTAAEITSACIAPDKTLSVGRGSGVLLSESTVLTAHHVVECKGTGTVMIEFPTGTATIGEVKVVDLEGDVALLAMLEPMKFAPARIGPKPAVDERICIVAAVPDRSRRCGEVKLWADRPGDVKHDAITEPGNSGSGVYDSRGRLVGIVTHFVRCRNGQYCGGYFTSLDGRGVAK
jgi:S1-C subfamily serine protease